jgi:hypothetical protein
MAKLLHGLFLCINIAIFGGCIYFVASRGVVAGAGWTPVELVTIVLAALAVLITVLGIFIAVLAIWGYTRLAADARDVATRAAQEHVGGIVPGLISEEIGRSIGQG